MRLPQLTGHIQINELYDESLPTIQGEGVDIGKPCFFIRTQHCPVKCPGCDSHWTYDGTEKGEKIELSTIAAYIDRCLAKYPKAGFVITGGEPLLHYRNEEFRRLLTDTRQRSWTALETSGFIGPKPVPSSHRPYYNYDLFAFFDCFKTVHLSPKITPCLHGDGWADEELTVNVPYFLKYHRDYPSCAKIALKFVARDEADFDAIDQFVDRYQILENDIPVYVMPFGIQPEEVIEGCKRLLPYCAARGYTLSPRLHSLMWGPKRGV